MPIEITPREPLTHKAKAAIEEYALFRCGDLHIFGLLIKYTLEAERMKRVKLYAFLEGRGYYWDPRRGWRQHAKKLN
jgi:hypothetical protein